MDIKDAYNMAADAYRKKYQSSGLRDSDVNRAFSYITKPSPNVLEIGCAYGREAQYILTKTNRYTGIDISDKYIAMAQREVPTGTFVCADVLEFTFPAGLDAVFAFASLLHITKEEMATILQRVASSLNTGGVIFLSLKMKDVYQSEMVDDGYSKRLFYYYNRQIIRDIKPDDLVEVFYDEQQLKESWFTMILQKQ